MRDSDRRSSISRVMRCACWRMMSRKRSRATASFRAGPCSVSTKPSSDAKGVRNSWLALATKSVRIASSRRADVRSRKNRTTPDLASLSSACDRSGPIWTSKVRSLGTCSEYSTRSGSLRGKNRVDAVENDGAAKRERQRMLALEAGQEKMRRFIRLDNDRALVHENDRIGNMGQDRIGYAGAA